MGAGAVRSMTASQFLIAGANLPQFCTVSSLLLGLPASNSFCVGPLAIDVLVVGNKASAPFITVLARLSVCI